MVINPNILTVPTFVYYLMLIPIIGMWTYSVWNKCEKNSKGKFFEKLFMAILDSLPVFTLMFLDISSWQLDLFILTVTLANLVIRINVILGAILYAIGYLVIGIDIMISYWSLGTFIVSLVIVIGLAIYVLSVKNLNKLVKLGGISYGIFSLIPLFYYFGVTLNIGFISLAIGDVLLGVGFIQEVNKKNPKVTNFISNCFFYVGVWLSVLSLV